MRRLLAGLAALLLSGTLIGQPAPAVAAPTWLAAASSWANPLGGQPRITNLRYATHPTFDRVVIDVQGRLPSYNARYVARHVMDGSGARVPIRGGLALTFQADAHTTNGTSTYVGPRLARPGYPTLKAVALTGDFEGYVGFGLGLSCGDGTRPSYRIWRLHSPQRIVVDVRHC